jgi:hypothetical protein
MFLALCGCGGDDDLSSYATSAVPPAGGAAAPARGTFIGRAWVAMSGPERGSVIAFLSDRSFLMSACPGPLQVSQWGVAGERIRWLEESVPVEAEVMLPSKDQLQLRIVGRDRPQLYVAVSPPFACPEAGW